VGYIQSEAVFYQTRDGHKRSRPCLHRLSSSVEGAVTFENVQAFIEWVRVGAWTSDAATADLLNET
jgi:hypothetical protein